MRALLAFESRQLLASRMAQLCLAVLALMLASAMANGRALLDGQIATRAAAAAEANEARTKLAEQVAKELPPAEAVLLPVRVREGLVSAVPPLAS